MSHVAPRSASERRPPARYARDRRMVALDAVLGLQPGRDQARASRHPAAHPGGASARSAAALIVAVWAQLRGIPLIARDGTLVPGIVAGVLFGLEFVLIYRGPASTPPRAARRCSSTRRRSSSRSARAGSCRPIASTCRNGSGSRCRLPAWPWRSACRRPPPIRARLLGDLMMVGGRRGLGRHHAGDQGERAQPHPGREDAALSARGLGSDPRRWRASVRRAASPACRRRSRSARSPTRPSGSSSVTFVVWFCADRCATRRAGSRPSRSSPRCSASPRPSGAGRAPDAGLPGRGRHGGGGPRAGEPDVAEARHMTALQARRCRLLHPSPAGQGGCAPCAQPGGVAARQCISPTRRLRRHPPPQAGEGSSKWHRSASRRLGHLAVMEIK